MQGDSPKNNGYQMVMVEMESEKETPVNPIIQAIKAGDSDELDKCLKKHGNIADVRAGAETSLHWAAKQDNFKAANACAEILIQHLPGNSSQLVKFINEEDFLGQNALVFAAWKGNEGLIQLLLRKGSKLGKSKKNETVFHYLAKLKNHDQSVRCARLCLDLQYYSDDPKQLHDYLDLAHPTTGYTALIEAARHANTQLMELLIKRGANALKSDEYNSTVLYYAVDNAYADKALACTATLMQDGLTVNWDEIKDQLMMTMDRDQRFPIHIAARRGFHEIFELLVKSCSITEGKTGYTALHLAAALGDPDEAAVCVRKLLEILPDSIQKSSVTTNSRAEYLPGSMDRKEYLIAQDLEGCTALYLAAANRNVEACQELLLADAGLDVKTKRGKSSLHKVYENIPEAFEKVLQKGLDNSGYVDQLGSIKLYMQLDYGPILGQSTKPENVYKETQDLANVRFAEFEKRKEILEHPLVEVFIFKKWEKIKYYFYVFRFIHIVWFLLNFYMIINVYRVVCPPEAGALNYTWFGLSPTGDVGNETKSLAECEMGPGIFWSGFGNLFLLFLFFLSRIHQFFHRIQWFCRPMKSFRGEKENPNCCDTFFRAIGHYVRLFFQVVPVWPLFISAGILCITLPMLGARLFDDFTHYLIAGVMGFVIWVNVYLEFGKIPQFRVYIILLKKSTITLLWAILVAAPLLCGFATVFVIFMPGEKSFSSALQSFVKVVTFMIGELDYSGLFYGDGDNAKDSLFIGVLRIALAIFVVFVVLLLVNFLIGLAAEEIRNFRERKQVWKLCVQLDQIAELELFLCESIPWCGRDFLRHELMLMPPTVVNDKVVAQRRIYTVYIPSLPQEMRKKLHSLHLKTIREEL